MTTLKQNKGYVRVPNEAPLRLKGEAFRAWVALRSVAPNFKASRKFLSKYLKLSDRQVIRLLEQIEEAGMLEKKVDSSGPGQDRLIYKAIMPYESKKAN